MMIDTEEQMQEGGTSCQTFRQVDMGELEGTWDIGWPEWTIARLKEGSFGIKVLKRYFGVSTTCLP